MKQRRISKWNHIMPKSFHISKYILLNATALLRIVLWSFQIHVRPQRPRKKRKNIFKQKWFRQPSKNLSLINTTRKVPVFRVFLNWIRTDNSYLSVFGKHAGKYGPEKLQIWALFTQRKASLVIKHTTK